VGLSLADGGAFRQIGDYAQLDFVNIPDSAQTAKAPRKARGLHVRKLQAG
jgi:hypothetical protein